MHRSPGEAGWFTGASGAAQARNAVLAAVERRLNEKPVAASVSPHPCAVEITSAPKFEGWHEKQ